MSLEPVPIIAAFTAGLVSIVSPCVLPLVPTYLTFLAGSAAPDAAGQRQDQRLRTLAHAFMFVLGFSAIFVAFGMSASLVGQALRAHAPLLRQLSGLLIIIFGAHLMGVFRWVLLAGEYRAHFRPTKISPSTAFVLGSSFGFGWTPCIGPVLASILILAGSRETLAEGALLLAAYSSGLGIPFLLMALFIGSFRGLLGRIQPHMVRVQQVSGALLTVVGIMILLNVFTIINSYVDWRF